MRTATSLTLLLVILSGCQRAANDTSDTHLAELVRLGYVADVQRSPSPSITFTSRHESQTAEEVGENLRAAFEVLCKHDEQLLIYVTFDGDICPLGYFHPTTGVTGLPDD